MAQANNEEVKTKREMAIERLKGRYPDKEFSDDEAIFGQISDDYDDLDKELSGYKDREQKLTEMFAADPKSAHFMMNWKNGADPVVELVRQFGTDIKEALDDPDRLEAIAEANKEYVERVAQEKELEGQYQDNLAESLKMLEAYQQEHGMSDEDVDKAMELLVGIVKDGIMGKFSPESVDMAMKALDYDMDVEDARAEGEIAGKNAKIDEKLRNSKKGDGVSALNGKNGGSGVRAPQPSLGALDNFGEGNQNIWERGGEKRVKYNS